VKSYVEWAPTSRGIDRNAWAERGAFATAIRASTTTGSSSQRVEEAVDMQLAARGLEKTSVGSADVSGSHSRALSMQRDQYRCVRSHAMRRLPCRRVRSSATVYEVGTLMIDVYGQTDGSARLARLGGAQLRWQ
jgi:hypothetical protein